ncbi:hypothetical protein ACFWYW_48525 [Nonomuraea sp. NPDC059023]|uniref:hypothetical protein n=1 Tax=unclassified Nonomuraea TaxID=2593643 RepID=UPI0036B57383
MDLTSCLSPYPCQPRADAIRLTWLPPRDDERCRVIAWTCDCRPVYFELCAAGGQTFIRRTSRTAKRVIIAETHRGPSAETQKIWSALTLGLVR